MNPTFIDNPDEPLPEEVWDFESYEFAESRDIFFVSEPTEEQQLPVRKKPKSTGAEDTGDESERQKKRRRRRAERMTKRTDEEEEAEIFEGRQPHPTSSRQHPQSR